MTDAKRLHETDFVLWSQEQAAALRAAARGASNQPLDWENLAEEIEDLAASQRYAVGSYIIRIVQCLVELAYSPAIEPRNGWRRTIRLARLQIEERIEDSPSLRPELGQLVKEESRRGIELAIIDLEEREEMDELQALVVRRTSFTVEQVLGDWFPPEPSRE